MLVSLRICLLPCCVWTEDENGEHFRRFCDGDLEQDLEGFDDALAGDTAEGLEGQEQHDGAAPDDSLRDDAEADAHEREHNDAEAERIFLEATAYGVDEERSQARPEPAASGRVGEEEGVEELEAGDGRGEGVQPCFFARPSSMRIFPSILTSVYAVSADEPEALPAEKQANTLTLAVGSIVNVCISAKEKWLGTILEMSSAEETVEAVMDWFDGSEKSSVVLAGVCIFAACLRT